MERGFKGIWIPAEVWLDERLTALDKMILGEISSLDTGEGCYASNKYLAEFCGCKEIKVSNSVTKLKEIGYLELVKFDGRQRILKSCLTKKIRQTYKKDKADLQKNKVSTLNNNIDYYTNRENKTAKRFTPPSYDDVKAYCDERGNSIDPQRFIDYYQANGWKVGKASMKDWKAAVRNWESREKPGEKKKELSQEDLEFLKAWGGGG